MKRIVLYTATAFIAGLFSSGLALAAGESYSGSERGIVEERHTDVPETGVTGSVTSFQLNEEQISEMQQILQDEGYDVAISGEIDSDTMSALEEFQSSEGLVVTGEPDENTLRALAPTAEEQEFFGLSPEFGEEESTSEGVESLEEGETLEQAPMEERIQETPRAID
jgi:peptidoglycan hydrolase-like protein with peptidoglycan-binding domain